MGSKPSAYCAKEGKEEGGSGLLENEAKNQTEVGGNICAWVLSVADGIDIKVVVSLCATPGHWEEKDWRDGKRRETIAA